MPRQTLAQRVRTHLPCAMSAIVKDSMTVFPLGIPPDLPRLPVYDLL